MKLEFKDVWIERMRFADFNEFMDPHPEYGKVGEWQITFHTNSSKLDPFSEVKDWIKQEIKGSYDIVKLCEDTVMYLSLFDFRDASIFYQKCQITCQLHWLDHMLLQAFNWYSYEVPHIDVSTVKEWVNKNLQFSRVGIIDGKLFIIGIDDKNRKKAEKAFSGMLVNNLFVRKSDKKSDQYRQGYYYFVTLQWNNRLVAILDNACTNILDSNNWRKVKIDDRYEYQFSSINHIKEVTTYAGLTN